ncbi:RNHCP domain protein, partial [Streptomyces sp. SID8455]|nr:RNHCP domain protein [Streptomyces sp. SID8455]
MSHDNPQHRSAMSSLDTFTCVRCG